MEKCRDQASRAGAIIQRLKELLRHPTPALTEQELNEIAASARELADSEALEAGVRSSSRSSASRSPSAPTACCCSRW